MLIAAASAQCGNGCLRCATSGSCLFCDVVSGFFLSNGVCTTSGDTRCLSFDAFGKCLGCSQKSYLDLAANRCVDVSIEIPNCQFYFSEKTCLTCQPGFMISSGNCATSTTSIANCEVVIEGGKCQICMPGYILSLNQLQCSTNPQVANCATYQSIQCQTCSTGYIKNQNFYLTSLFGFTYNGQMNSLAEYMKSLNKNRIDNTQTQVCQKGEVPNCVTHLSFSKCGVCQFGYFVNGAGICEKYPQQSIPNCSRYSSLTTCIECSFGFRITKTGQCDFVIPVTNCLLYNTTSVASMCRKCVAGYRLLGRNKCVARRINLKNCSIYSDSKDACLECETGFYPTEDGLSCLPSLYNCDKMAPSNRFTTALTCDACSPGYFIGVNQICTLGSVLNCAIFERKRDACAVCQNKFTLSNGNCVAQDVIVGCDNYHLLSQNVCKTCKSSAALMKHRVRCQAVDIIPFCQVYFSRNVCRNCLDGFMLINNQCQTIPPAENCLQKKANYCTKCLKDFINDDGICKSPLDYIVINCEKTNVDGIIRYKSNTCSVCKENSFPWQFKNNFICIENTYATVLNKAPLSENCIQYVPFNNALICVKCDNNMIINNGVCGVASACTTTIYRQIIESEVVRGDNKYDSIYVKSINVCGPKIPHCAIAAPDLDQPFPINPRYTCIQCDSTKLPVINLNSPTSTLIKSANPANTNLIFGASPVSYHPGATCIDIVANTNPLLLPIPTGVGILPINYIKRLGKFVGNEIPNCDYYSLIEPGLGCVKCKHAYTGIVLNVVNQCKKYRDNYYCLECNQGFYLAQPHECQQVTAIPNCVSYDPTAISSVCIACSRDSYVTNSGASCTLRVRSLGVLNANMVANSDTVSCFTGYVQLPTALSVSTANYICQALPSNCNVAEVTSDVVTGCTTCNPAISYINNLKQCLIGTIANCAAYSQVNSNTCVTCNNKFYLSNNTCLPHTLSMNPNCSTFSQSALNTCDTCSNTSMKFTMLNQCRQINIINNCMTYSSTTECLTCNDGYRLANLRTACNAIPSSENCLKMTPVDLNSDSSITIIDVDINTEFVYQCDKCLSGYYRISKTLAYTNTSNNQANASSFMCVKWLNYKFSNCFTNNVDGTGDSAFTQGCLSCKSDMYSTTFVDKYVCTERDYQAKTNPALVITDCKVIQKNAGTYECIKCNYPKVLSAALTCLDACALTSDVYIVNDVEISAPAYTITKGQCAAAAAPLNGFNCAQAAPLIDNGATITYGCIKCHTGFQAVYKINKADAVAFNITASDEIKTPLDAFPVIDKCYDSTTVRILTAQANVYLSAIPNCRSYVELETNGGLVYVGCAVCSYGYTGVLTQYTPIVANAQIHNAYIPECTAMLTSGAGGCSTSDLAHGLGLGLDLSYTSTGGPISWFYSCLQCSDNTQIPTVGISYDYTNKNFVDIVKFGISATPRNTGSGAMQTTCATHSTLPANCGLAVYNNLSVDNDSSEAASLTFSATAKIASFCTACKPGFYPTFGLTSANIKVPNIVVACTAIDSCASSSWFNACSSCVYKYDHDTDLVDYSKCITPASGDTTLNSVCFAANIYKKCMICKKGYDMNTSGVCVSISTPNCLLGHYSNPLKSFTLSKTGTANYLTTFLKTSHYFMNDFVGCTSCSSTQILTKVNVGTDDANLTEQVCVSKAFALPTTYAINNCANNLVDPDKKCAICQSGFVLTTTGECISQTVNKYLHFCSLALLDTFAYCNTCQNTLTDINVGGMCVTRATILPNCKTFGVSNVLAQAICTTCNDQFYLDQGGKVCSPISNTYPNCAELNNGNNACVRCKNNYVLTTLSNSVAYCYPTQYVQSFDPNCVIYTANDFNGLVLKCDTCATGFFPVTYTAGNYCNSFAQNMNSKCLTYDISNTNSLTGVTLNCLTCVNNNLHFYDPLLKTCFSRQYIDLNCNTYVTNADECQICNDNYVLDKQFKRTCLRIPAIINFNPLNKGYLQSCSPMTTCVDTVFNEGLSKSVSSLLSCHTCGTAGQIPFLVGKGGWPFSGIVGLQGYSTNIVGNQRYMEVTGDASTRCIAPTAASLNITASLFSFPSNCGVGFLNANSLPDASSSTNTVNVDRTKIAAICVACQPKFSATFGADINGPVKDMIASCTSISNCESSSWFNYCSQCSPNYVYAYVPGQGVKYDQCISYESNVNCFAVDIKTQTGKNICVFCKSGYTLNIDGICELMRTPRCFIPNFRFKENYIMNDLNSGLLLSKEGPGCQKCDTGFVAIFNDKPMNICSQSPYISYNMVLIDSQFIYKCKNYFVTNNRLRCQTCQDGFILKVDGRCVDATSQPTCTIAFDSQYCSDCNSTVAVNVDHTCNTQTILNCVTYANAFWYSQPICTTCAKGFFLDANTCRPNTVANCELSDANRTCTKCLNGFETIRAENTTDYCFAIDQDLNCTTLSRNWLQKGQMVCSQCNPGNLYHSTLPSVNSYCMNAQPIDNCLKYDVKPGLARSTFQCTQCTSSFFLNQSLICQRRILNEPNCVRFNLNADLCIECTGEFYLSVDGKSCTKYPDGIANCRTYSFRSTCSACAENFYLLNNVCYPVPKQLVIDNCQYYDDLYTCNTCKGAFAVTEGKCTISVAQNCEKYLSSTACLTCPANYGLKEDSGLINCVIIATENCLIAETVFPFNCLTCKNKFFMKEGACVAVTSVIDSCLIYSTDATCKQCDIGTALSIDAKNCTKISSLTGFLDPNCQISEIKANSNCLTCKNGYFFQTGQCVKCLTDMSCYTCDPLSPKTCLMCATGYYQTETGVCIANGQKPTPVSTTNLESNTLSYADYRTHIN